MSEDKSTESADNLHSLYTKNKGPNKNITVQKLD